MQINGKTFALDLLDVPTLRNVQDRLKAVQEQAAAFGQNIQEGSTTLLDVVMNACALVYHFFDEVLGDSAAEQIFDKPLSDANFNTCIRVATEFSSGLSGEINRQIRETLPNAGTLQTAVPGEGDSAETHVLPVLTER